MKNFDRKLESFFPQQFIMLGYLLDIIGIIIIVLEGDLLGIVLIFTGLGLSFAKTGVKINFHTNEYKEYYFIYWLKFGKWKEIQSLDYININIENTFQVMSVRSISRGVKNKKIKVNLIVSKIHKINTAIFDIDEKDKAMETAEFLAENLKTKLLDYTSIDPKWIRINREK